MNIGKVDIDLPLEDINTNLEQAMDTAVELLKADGKGIQPMLEIVVLHSHPSEQDGKPHIEKMPYVFDPDIDFSDRQQKLQAVYQVGHKLGEDLGEELIPLQVTMMSEAWQREGPSLDEAYDAHKIEVVIATTRSWNGRAGLITHRIVRDTDDKVIGTALSQEAYATDEKDTSVESLLLKMFFLSFALGAVRERMSPELLKRRAEIEKDLQSFLKF